MSRFFAKPGESSEESSTEEETTSDEESSSEDEKPQKKAGFVKDEPSRPSGPRKLMSQKDKRYDEMRTTVKQLKNVMTINDWNSVVTEFQKINQQLAKHVGLGNEVPGFYIKIMLQLAELCEETFKDKEKIKKFSKTNSKSFNAMRQNIKKNNAQYEEQIAKFQENPEEEEAEEEAEEESESSEEESSSSDEESEDEEKEKEKPKASKPKKNSDDEDDDDDDESDWGSDSSSSSSDAGPTSGLTGISKWMKTGKDDEDSDDDGFEKVNKNKRPAKEKKEKEVKEDQPKKVQEQMVLNEENVKKKMEEIMSMRGKKGTSKRDQITQLELLSTAKIVPSMTAQVLVALISAQFDSSMTRGGVAHMPISFETEEENGVKVPSRASCLWTKCMYNIKTLLNVLKENPELTEESTGQSASAGDRTGEVVELEEGEEQLQVSSNLVSFFERLDDELYLSLRLLDNHSPEFLKRLLDIAPILELAEDVQDYYEKLGNNAVTARVAMRRLEHMYYKHDLLVAKAASITPQKGDRATNRGDFINSLAMQVYKYGDDSVKTRAMLCHIYYHALHDRFYQARDMLLMSHLQDTVHQTNSIPTQILFNRVMAQLGLSAFRNGLIPEAHQCFDELCQNNRLKELLAQGLPNQRFANERTQEQERAEKRRQTPYHMHMNLELIECCHLVGAVLIEIPKMVANAYDTKRKVASKALKRVFDNSDRNPLAGPPETTRDVIFAGARSLEKGNWRQCEEHILSLPVWVHLGSEEVVDTVKKMLKQRIQEEALRTFLFAYSAYYDALSVDQLCEMFQLEKKAVNSLVSKMIISDELFASWDQPTGSIVMHKKERSRLHHLALQFSDIIGKFVETNEKGWDNKYGGYGFREQNKQGGGKWQGGGGRGGMGGGDRGGDRGDRRDGGGDRRDRRDGGNRDDREKKW